MSKVPAKFLIEVSNPEIARARDRYYDALGALEEARRALQVPVDDALAELSRVVAQHGLDELGYSVGEKILGGGGGQVGVARTCRFSSQYNTIYATDE